MKHKAIIIVAAIAALALSACSTTVNPGTETDNTDIMVPTDVQKVAEGGFEFTFDSSWKHDGDLLFRPADVRDSSYVAVTIIDDQEVADLEAYAEARGEGDFVQDEGAELDTVIASREISGGRVEEAYVLNDSKVVHVFAVLTGASADIDLPIDVSEDPDFQPVLDVKVCAFGKCGTKGSDLEVYGQYETYSTVKPELMDPESDSDSDDLQVANPSVYELAPEVQVQVQVQQIAPITIEGPSA